MDLEDKDIVFILIFLISIIGLMIFVSHIPIGSVKAPIEVFDDESLIVHSKLSLNICNGTYAKIFYVANNRDFPITVTIRTESQMSKASTIISMIYPSERFSVDSYSVQRVVTRFISNQSEQITVNIKVDTA